MKSISILIFSFLASLAHATESLEIQEIGSINPTFLTISKDCQKVYTSPGKFKISLEKSPILFTNEAYESGAETYVTPKILLNFRLVPVVTETTDNLKMQIEQLSQKNENCKSIPSIVEPYPALLKVITGSIQNSDNLMFVSAKWTGEQAIDAKFEISAINSNIEEIKEKLRRAILSANILTYNLEPEVEIKLTVGHDALSNFAEKHYTEQVCYEKETCLFGAFGVKLGCRTQHSCDQIPRVIQVFQDMNLKSLVKIEIHSAADVPEYKVTQAYYELFSKFLMSTFQETSKKSLGDLTVVTPGKFTKEYKDTYQDEITTTRVVETKIQQEFTVEGLQDIIPKIQSILDSNQVKCLRKFAKTNPEIKINNPCLK